ncbi:hypothetical protein DV532_27920 (plasmid) [Pseudomonas sp. Leaf58]|uniref:hypothetical protein n=1 Tax=Pseudomonas sp. Leaf58 TaxID=1736226 RepID=UPI0006FCA6B4|nr:hypothetical protein [Pseudomonas sp. Leaf58]AYG48109.1 hypothetical protein DV532_27920 [Pseudomonas sp. Leaf58]KQN62337.1 hypothetical protein ASF02_09300 [Pseudomonas sp. Leaf58]
MNTRLPGVESVALHPAVQAKIEAMQKARRQELVLLKGGALGFAECQLESGSEGEVYQASVVARVNEAFDRRERYLANVPLALMAFPTWLFLLVATIAWLVASVYRGLWIAGEPIFLVTLGFLVIFHAIIHFAIGFKALWHELCLNKWAWSLLIALIVFCSVVSTKAIVSDDAPYCLDECNFSNRADLY